MKARGRPVLGAISGLLFGLFVAVDLQQFGVRPLDNLSFFGLPLLGLLVGIGLAMWAPLRRGRAAAPRAFEPAPSSPPSEPPSSPPSEP